MKCAAYILTVLLAGFQCGEQHEDTNGDPDGHWRRPPGCPRYRSLDIRRGDRIPKWDYADFEVQDVARRLLDSKQIRIFDAVNRHSEPTALNYPPSRQQELPQLDFVALLDHSSPYGSLARRVVDTHDRLLVGDLTEIWSKDRMSAPGVDSFADGKPVVELLTSLRHLVIDIHNEHGKTNLRLSDSELLQRVTFTHYV